MLTAKVKPFVDFNRLEEVLVITYFENKDILLDHRMFNRR
jgi:hypothetical protein